MESSGSRSSDRDCVARLAGRAYPALLPPSAMASARPGNEPANQEWVPIRVRGRAFYSYATGSSLGESLYWRRTAEAARAMRGDDVLHVPACEVPIRERGVGAGGRKPVEDHPGTVKRDQFRQLSGRLQLEDLQKSE